MGQGLAGTIDMRTVRPLDYGKQAVVLNLRGEMNSNDDLGADSDDQGYRASFSYVDQFMDGKLGLAFGYAHLDTPMATRGFGTYEPWNPSGSVAARLPATAARRTGCSRIRVSRPASIVTERHEGSRRHGFDRARRLHGHPAVRAERHVQHCGRCLLLDDEAGRQRAQPRDQSYGLPGALLRRHLPGRTVFGYSDTTVKNDTVVAGTLNNVVPLARNFLFKTEDEILAAGLAQRVHVVRRVVAGGRHQLFESHARARSVRNQGAVRVPGATAPTHQYDTGTFQLRGNSDMPSLSFGRDYADPASGPGGPDDLRRGLHEGAEVEDELTSFRVDATRTAEMWWFQSASFGVNYSDRTKDKISPEAGLGTIGGGLLTRSTTSTCSSR